MKLTAENVYKLAHEMILNIEPFAAKDDREARDLLMYSAGITDMAQAVVEALQEVRNV